MARPAARALRPRGPPAPQRGRVPAQVSSGRAAASQRQAARPVALLRSRWVQAQYRRRQCLTTSLGRPGGSLVCASQLLTEEHKQRALGPVRAAHRAAQHSISTAPRPCFPCSLCHVQNQQQGGPGAGEQRARVRTKDLHTPAAEAAVAGSEQAPGRPSAQLPLPPQLPRVQMPRIPPSKQPQPTAGSGRSGTPPPLLQSLLKQRASRAQAASAALNAQQQQQPGIKHEPVAVGLANQQEQREQQQEERKRQQQPSQQQEAAAAAPAGPAGTEAAAAVPAAAPGATGAVQQLSQALAAYSAAAAQQ